MKMFMKNTTVWSHTVYWKILTSKLVFLICVVHLNMNEKEIIKNVRKKIQVKDCFKQYENVYKKYNSTLTYSLLEDTHM